MQNSDTTEDVKMAIQKNFQKMGEAMAKGDLGLLASYFTEDALLKFSGKEPIQGRVGITKAHQEMLDRGILVKPETTEVQSFGEMAYEIGTYQLVTSKNEKIDSGYYATIWKKVDGNWKIFRDIISSTAS